MVAWRKLAETVSKYFTKGRTTVVESRLQLRDWTDKEGGKRRSAEIVAEHVYFGNSKPKAESSGGTEPPAPPEGFVPEFFESGDGELPF